MQKSNGVLQQDYGTNCADCERYRKLGDVCVIEHGKKFLWEYCRDFVPNVVLPDYKDLMRSVREDQTLERQRLKAKKDREKRKKLKERMEREALRKKERRARLRRIREKKKLEIMKKLQSKSKPKKDETSRQGAKATSGGTKKNDSIKQTKTDEPHKTEKRTARARSRKEQESQ